MRSGLCSITLPLSILHDIFYIQGDPAFEMGTDWVSVKKLPPFRNFLSGHIILIYSPAPSLRSDIKDPPSVRNLLFSRALNRCWFVFIGFHIIFLV